MNLNFNLDGLTMEEAVAAMVAAIDDLNLEKAQKSGLGAFGRNIVARDLTKPSLDRASQRLEEIWARTQSTTREGMILKERDLFQAEMTGHLQHYLQTFRDGLRSLSSTEWYIKRELRQGYERQFVLGLEAAGKFRPPTKAELRYLRGMRYRDFRHLRNFLQDVKDGKGVMDYKKRMNLYAVGGRQAYWAGVIYGTPRDKCLKWVLGVPEHCKDCIHLAQGGPWKQGIYYRRDLLRMGVFPGGHKTECYRGCKCRLDTVDKPSRRPPWTAPYRRVKGKRTNAVRSGYNR